MESGGNRRHGVSLEDQGMRKNMTDKQIAFTYIDQLLKSYIPDYDDLRAIANAELSDARAEKIVNRIIAETGRVRRRYADYLTKCGQ
jgi:hypothetical protein